jgi:hypothetical protein
MNKVIMTLGLILVIGAGYYQLKNPTSFGHQGKFLEFVGRG